MPAPADALLERLAESAELGSEIERKRMLVIVNPYATTVSDRLRHLVVYALQGRYEVDAVDTEARDHATELCREAAHEGYDVVVAFGGDGTVNEAANGLIGSETPLSCLPGGSTNVYCADARHPRRHRRRHRAPAAHGRRLAARASVDLGVVNGRSSRSRPGSASTRASSSASTPTRG